MRIVSKFRDYYDGLADYSNKDRLNYVWNRQRDIIEIPKHKLKYLEERAKDATGEMVRPLYIIIAGKVFPIIKHFTGHGDNYLYVKQELVEKYPQYFKSPIRQVKKQSFFEDYPDYTWLNLELNSPIVVFNPWKHTHYYQGYNKETREVVINDCLKDYQFTKFMHAYEIYQMLDHFVSNVMIKDEMPTYPRTDVEKLESYGFDKKTSFRNVK